MEELLQNYLKEIEYKISLKMIPNKTEQQILYNNFKYFDLNSTGFCGLSNFIKTNDKIGVLMKDKDDLIKVFNYFDQEGNGCINYKNFIEELFSLNKKSLINKISEKPKENKYIKKNVKTNVEPKDNKKLFEKVAKNIQENELGKGVALLNLYQDFIYEDNDFKTKLTINEYAKILKNNLLNLTNVEKQQLFHSYENNNDGYFLYEDLITDLINIYWNDERNTFSLNIIKKILLDKNNAILLPNLYSIINLNVHNENTMSFIKNKLNIIEPMEYYNNLIRNYIGLKRAKNYPQNKIITNKELLELFTYISFGIKNNNDFYTVINNLFNAYITLNLSYKKEKFIKNNYTSDIRSDKYTSLESVNELRDYLIDYGSFTLFNLIKQFNYYNLGNFNINKYDFAKVLKDFKINLTVSLIEEIFIYFTEENNLNYIQFISLLLNEFITSNRKNFIENIFDKICNYFGKDIISLNNLISIHNDKVDENFEDSFNIFLENYYKNLIIINPDYKNEDENNNNVITKNKFLEYYKFISFLIKDDNKFYNIVNTEWNKINSNIYDIINKKDHGNKINEIFKRNKDINNRGGNKSFVLENNNKPYDNINNNINNYKRIKECKKEQEDTLEILTKKLKDRGIRGLMNLHKQFIFTCKDLSCISIDDFIKVLKNQRLLNNEIKINELFNKYIDDNEYLNFQKFIRTFKKVLNNNRLEAVKKAYMKLDTNSNDNINIEQVKFNFNAKYHPLVLNKIKNEEEILMEFLDCFELNYNLLTTDETDNENISNMVTFEEFANFYEYVSFLYDNDNDFIHLINAVWLQ